MSENKNKTMKLVKKKKNTLTGLRRWVQCLIYKSEVLSVGPQHPHQS